MRVVMAPDSFKSTMSAAEAARAMGEGWSEVRPEDDVVLRPMADGGEGTLDAFASLPGAERIPVDVVDAVGRPRRASWVRLADGAGVVELAECCGLLTIDALAPREAHTLGFGMAIRSAIEAGAERLLLAIGGSASTDGGLGLLVGLGVAIERPDGVSTLGNAALPHVVSVDWSGAVPVPSGGATVLSDVTNPLLGDDGAAAVFGPQKGGAPFVAQLDAALASWAAVLGGDPQSPGAGAAGGAGFALRRWGATSTSGALAVADAVGLREALWDADLVVTGEGAFDAQTASGKVVDVVRRMAAEVAMARQRALPVAVVAGRMEARYDGPAVELWALAGERALSDAVRVTRDAGRRLARTAQVIAEDRSNA